MIRGPVFLSALAVALSIVLLPAALPAIAAQPVTITFGTLPVLQALPLFVAAEQGLFSDAGIAVELVPFNTAAEKDIALSGQAIDGYFGDLFTPMVIKGNGVDVRIVATNFRTSKDRRMFGILGKPRGPYDSAADLAGVPVAVSSNSVIDYCTVRLLEQAGVDKEQITTLESKNIGIRVQMLLAGQIEAATLPEPLVTAAIKAGAPLLADDTGLPASRTVLVFSQAFLDRHPDAVKAFLSAIQKANDLINGSPDPCRAIMVEHVRLPDPLADSYPVPTFPALDTPDRAIIQRVKNWLKERGVLERDFAYEDIVDAGYLP